MRVEDIRQYTAPVLGSNMFVLCAGTEALVIDPHISETALAYLHRQKVEKLLILLTHEHYDHTSGLIWLTEQFKSTLVCQAATAEALQTGRNNRPVVVAARAIRGADTDVMRACIQSLPRGYTYKADRVFETEERISWQGYGIRLFHTPGHSLGSCCIELDGSAVVTGDSLIRHTPVITRFPGGSREVYRERTLPYLRGIPEGTLILPGHGETFPYSDLEGEKCFVGI